MIQLASTASNHIRYLLQSLDNSNSDSVFQELIQFASYGTEGSILVLGIFFDHLNIYGKDLKSLQLEPAFASVFKYLLDKPNFSTVFCKSVRGAAICEEFLGNLCTALHLTVSEKMFVGLALSYVEDVDIKMCGKNFCIIQFGELCSTRMSVEYAKIVQNMRLKRLDLLMNMLSLAQSKEGTPFIVVPLLSDEIHEAELSSMSFDLLNEGIEDDFDALLAEMEKEMSMADIMKELGYGCTASVLQCKEILSLFLPLTEITVARILGMTVYTYSGLEDNHNILLSLQTALGSSSLSDLPPLSSWNTDVLIDAINQLAPGLNWGIIIGNLDHEGFYVPNEASFSFLMSMYRLACQDPFPLHAICGSVWKNAEGQLSFLRYAVLAPPELFTFAHSGRQLAYVDAVKDHKLQPGHANHAWLCLDLLEVFCQLAERGHASLIRSILEYPLKHCPEVLLLGLAHINTAYNLLQHEVSSIVFPIILKNTLGTGMILYLWNVNPSILLRGFMDAMEDDPDSINKVLDSCQELQILSPVLDMIPYSFGIRLAALASYKEFIDLGKWLNTNLRTYKDNFYEECLKFIKEAFFSAEDDSTNRFRPPKSLLNSYLETASVFMKALQSCTGSVSSLHLSEELEKLTLHLSEELEKLNLTCMDSNSSLENIYADSNDIEASANSYFKLMFSEQLTIESMIQMLVHFKESSEKREKSIFKVMISSLFEEYKFFPKYPDNQLKTAAIIFGSLIKHHLVTHLNLKITLKAVLDALQEPADTRMFGFGTLALEQFEDVLIELPGFCYHISKIPHLCAAKPQLIQFIEHEYARASVVNSELDEGNNFVATQFPGSIRSSQSSIEGSTLPLTACGISYPEMQVTSHIQLPQREHSTLDTRKLLNLHCQANPALSSIDQAVAGPSSVATCIPKLHSTSSSSAANSYSHGIAHPARANSTRGFGSALNIETLVAAAERRQTLIEVPPSEVQDKISFIMNNLSAANIKVKAKEIVEILKEEHYPWFAQYIVMKRASIEPNYQALYVKLLDEVNLKELFKEVVQATYENCKVLLQSGLIKSSSEERSLLKNLGSWLGKITIGRDQVLLAREINPKSLIIEAYEKGLMIAVIPFTSKILESCQNSLAYQLPNAWTMAILGLLVEIHAMPTLKMNLKFDIEVLFKNLGVDLKDINPTSLLKDRVRELEGNPDFSNKDAGSSQPQFNGDIKLGIMSNLNQGELSVGVASMSHPGHQSHIVSQHAASVYLPSRTLTDKGKLTALVSDQHLLPSAQGLLQGQTPFSVSQLPTTASNIEQQVIVNPKLHEFGLHSHFQSVLPIAMKKAIEDIVMSIVHRSISIATQTTKELVLKDYAMEPNQTRIRNAAHLMVASLAGSLAHATCKESLWCSISSQLRNTLEGIDNANELLELAIQVVTNDNLDLGCALIEQIAITKAIQIIDETIAIELASMTHREEPTYTDSCIYTEQCRGVLPEALSPNSGHLSYSQQRGYEDFVRLPWQNQSIQSSNALSLCPASSNSSILSRAYVAGSAQMSTDIYSSGLFKAGVVAVPNHLDIVSEKIDSSSSQLHSASLPPIGVGDGASSCNFGNDSIATPFSSVLLWPVRPCNVVKGTWRSLQPRNPTPSSEDLGSSVSEPSLTTGDAQDKYQIILEKVPMMFDEWYRICEIPGSKDAASANYVLQLHHSGLLNGDDVSDCFFHKLMEISVLHCLSSEVVSLGLSQASETKTLPFLAIDIYAKLVYSLVKFYPVDQGTSKISLLYRVLAVTVKFIQRDSEEKKSSFDPRPYFRLFINWIFDLCSSDPIFDGANFQVLTVLASAFHALQPLKVPGFSFAWLELVTHRCFMPKLLTGNAQKGWPYLLQLLVDMFRFMEPFLSTAELREPVRFLYEGTLRVLLVLHHDFPEFLCDYHFSFCDMIPPTCAQMRNIVLSAVPHNIKPPNPSVCGLTIDLLLPELRLAPRILSEVDAALKARLIKSDIDQYLKTRQMASLFLSELKQTLILSPSEAARAGTSYNVPLINSLVLYVGIWAVQYRQPSTTFNSLLMANRAPDPSTVVLAACDIFLTLMDLDKDGCYWFLNAIANQLRYPNNHTHYFSIVILHLFASSNQEIIQEQIIRVILERLVVKPPHPWGLLVIFRELTENKDYNLWNKSFIRSSPDIANLLRSLMRGKLPNPPVD